jgi:hypothetical protein
MERPMNDHVRKAASTSATRRKSSPGSIGRSLPGRLEAAPTPANTAYGSRSITKRPRSRSRWQALASASPSVQPLTIAQAKQGLALTFGVDPSCIKITVEG